MGIATRMADKAAALEATYLDAHQERAENIAATFPAAGIYVGVVSMTAGSPDGAFEKWMNEIRKRYPNQRFEILTLQTHQTNIGPSYGWAVTGTIRKIVDNRHRQGV